MMSKIEDSPNDNDQSQSANDNATDYAARSVTLSRGPEVLTLMEGPDGITYVKSGSVSKLIERLVDPDTFDIPYMQAFILTHRQFVSSASLLECLIGIFNDRSAGNKKKSSIELLRYIFAIIYLNLSAHCKTQTAELSIL
jgi:hypothetical protein